MQPKLHQAEETCVRAALPKRRREFAAGRACARGALRQLGVRDFPLVPGAGRAPVWPHGIVGSITHCANYVAAVVAKTERLSGVGIDAEPGQLLARDLVPLVCTADEISQLDQLPPDVAWTTLMFSAKESFFKCYYPQAGCLLDFLDVEIDLQPAAARFRGRLVRSDAPSIFGRRDLEGRFGWLHGLWLTQVSV